MNYNKVTSIAKGLKGRNSNDDPRDMESDFLLETLFQLRIRTNDLSKTNEHIFHRYKELESEVLRRMNNKTSAI